MTETFDIIVIGAGIAGLSIASALAGDFRVAVLERESRPGLHATGRTAAVMAFCSGTPVVQALTRYSLGYLSRSHAEIGGAALLKRRGLVTVAREDQLDLLHDRFATLRPNGMSRWLEAEDVAVRVPLLRPGYAAAGLLEAEARDIDVGLLQGLYRNRLAARGAALICDAAVTGLLRRGDAWLLQTQAGSYGAGLVINAAGAWADQIGALAGAAEIGLSPTRRTGIAFAAPRGLDPATVPMVLDVEDRFYLKPDAGRLMASPGDETPVPPCDARAEPLDVAICADRIMAAFDLIIRQPDAAWAGLRSFVSDRNPVCGFDRQVDGFFWLAGQGGAGIQTAPALARIARALITGRDPAVGGVSLAELSPTRLTGSYEEL